MSENEKLRAALANCVSALCSVRKNYEEPKFGLWDDVSRFISEGNAALSAPPSKADADDVSPRAWLYEKDGKQSLQFERQISLTRPDRGWTETPLYASAIQSRDAGLREAYDAAAYLIECLDAVSRGVPVRNLDEAWERYGKARAALQMGGEKP